MSTMLDNRAKFLMRAKSNNTVLQRYQPAPGTPLTPDMIIPNLYLTDMFTARGVLLPTYAGHGRPVIKYVLSVLDNSISQPKPKPVNAASFVQKLIILDDTQDADLLARLAEGCDFIVECLGKNDGGVMVHCQLGQSRSASMVIAYLMREQGLTFQKAWDKVKYKRSIVKPNPGFQKQLALWEEMQCNIMEADVESGVEGQMRKKEIYVKWKEEQKERIQRVLTL